ncbi:3-phosphoshikimate 1-carboxyvinyltransferase [Alienimonas californiensis]|uniref:3-phosphoshikimate 1-carboxyvinyltransferase n=1 Tax=Alienimonas californiensis TaxID=2527989 RepID=A0A517P936_9PLAN|nr:3-phosphoshikimate 1-carboxyvinyltransferase [Alienimonas californiensis]QDT15890.1 3-phosphoshikimate 1-carboxyvinyltransferase [Alienimonas californiensis]
MLDSLPDPLPITPVEGFGGATLRPPGSKSLTNRALAVAALAEGTSTLTGVLDSDDTRVMLNALTALGLDVDHNPVAATVRITGCGGELPANDAGLFCENSGTSIRFLTALIAAAGRGTYRLDGVARMRQRPIGDLVDALNQLGAEVTCDLANGCPPLTVHTTGLSGGTATVESGASSQFLSALMMAAPAARGPLTLRVPGELVSVPYVVMTRRVLEAFGVRVSEENGLFHIAPQTPTATEYAVEPDASAASYWFAAAAILGGTVTVEGLGTGSVQGDMDFLRVLRAMGCEVRIEEEKTTVTGPPHGRLKGGQTFDMGPISDTAQTAAAVAVFADGPTTVTGIAHARHKETDRVAAVVTELRKLGQECEEHADGFTIVPKPVTPAIVHTYDDHRMAMSFALIGLRENGVQIADPGCVAKTYPGFWQDLQTLTGREL